MRRFSFLVLTLGLSLGATAAAAGETLTVYTYDSFTSEWGPGPAIETAFESQCGCDLEWVTVDDAALLLSRLRLEGDNTDADVVLGLDTNLMAEAETTGLLQPHGIDMAGLDLPVAWDDPVFVPFDYGYFAIVYDSEVLPEPPASLAELVENGDGPKLIIQDPRTSTPGLGLLLWMQDVYGDDAAAAWTKLNERVLTVTKGWSEAYGLFLDGEAPMVLSYTTSPAYHQIVEETDRYRAAVFAEGNYLQVELAAMTAGTDNRDLAREFLAFVLTRDFQETIPTGNWMYPVIDLGDDLPQAFRDLPKPPRALLIDSGDVAAHRSAWIDAWLGAMTQ
jgi:thiamine transport system substrate-binding protein